MKQSRNALMGLFALSAAVAMPMAFAQEQKAAQPAATTQATAAAPPDSTAAATPTQAQPAAQAPTGDAKPRTWTDIDGDKDGNISKSEAASEPAVGQIFDLADTNKDSKLTPDEYKAYVAKANGAPKPAGQGG